MGYMEFPQSLGALPFLRDTCLYPHGSGEAAAPELRTPTPIAVHSPAHIKAALSPSLALLAWGLGLPFIPTGPPQGSDFLMNQLVLDGRAHLP